MYIFAHLHNLDFKMYDMEVKGQLFGERALCVYVCVCMLLDRMNMNDNDMCV